MANGGIIGPVNTVTEAIAEVKTTFNAGGTLTTQPGTTSLDVVVVAGGGPGSCNKGSGTCGQGNPGGTGFDAAPGDLTGGGGGGASAAGTIGSPPSSGGPGGAGTDFSPYIGDIGPTCSVFAGGGGGAKRSGTQGTGGTGGGGAARTGSNGVAGTTNTGGGGGGNGPISTPSGAGGSGIVIIRYKFQ